MCRDVLLYTRSVRNDLRGEENVHGAGLKVSAAGGNGSQNVT